MNDALGTAVARTLSVNLAFDGAVRDQRVNGVRNAQMRAASYQWNNSSAIATDDRFWARGSIDDRLPSDAWVQVNVPAVAGGCDLASVVNPVILVWILTGATSAKQVSSTYTGTLDLGKVTGPPSVLKGVEYFRIYGGGNPSAVPFTATTDLSGFVTSVTAGFPEVPNSLRLGQFGTSAPVRLPGTGVIEAPAYWYA